MSEKSTNVLEFQCPKKEKTLVAIDMYWRISRVGAWQLWLVGGPRVPHSQTPGATTLPKILLHAPAPKLDLDQTTSFDVANINLVEHMNHQQYVSVWAANQRGGRDLRVPSGCDRGAHLRNKLRLLQNRKTAVSLPLNQGLNAGHHLTSAKVFAKWSGLWKIDKTKANSSRSCVWSDQRNQECETYDDGKRSRSFCIMVMMMTQWQVQVLLYHGAGLERRYIRGLIQREIKQTMKITSVFGPHQLILGRSFITEIMMRKNSVCNHLQQILEAKQDCSYLHLSKIFLQVKTSSVHLQLVSGSPTDLKVIYQKQRLGNLTNLQSTSLTSCSCALFQLYVFPQLNFLQKLDAPQKIL